MRIVHSESRAIGDAAGGGGGRALVPGCASLILALLMLLSIVPAAGADVGTTIIDKCIHGQSLSGFSQQDYSRALQELPTEVEEYSNCGNLIRRAQLAAAGGGAGAVGGPAAIPIPLTPTERTALKSVPNTGAAPVRVGGQVIRPGVMHANVSSALSSLPTPLLAILALMLAFALLQAGSAIRNRVRTHRSR
jgi:hypothetical protein